MHVQFFYNVNEFLQFFPKLCDTQGRLGGTRGPGGAPPKGVPHMGTPRQQFRYSTFLEYLRIVY